MVVAAELLEPPITFEAIINAEFEPYRRVDSYASLALERIVAYEEASSLLEQRREQLREGDFDAVPIPVDALGTARRALAARDKYGPESVEYKEYRAGLTLDCKRLYTEAVSKNISEYFPLVKRTFDAGSGQHYSSRVAIRDMTRMGLTPVAEPEEIDRRINEDVHEATFSTIGQLLTAKSVSLELVVPQKVRTIYPCPDYAIDAYRRGSSAGGGYVPPIEKFMVADSLFDPETGDRYDEQMGLSGIYITDKVKAEALALKGIPRAEAMSKTEMHASQLAVEDDLFDFVALLDTIASEHSGLPIYLGEILPEGEERRYDLVREQAIERQRKLDQKAEDLTERILQLEESGTDRWLALGIVEQTVKGTLFEMATKDPAKAGEMFDKKTQLGLEKVAELISDGRNEAASRLLATVESQAPAPGYCGTGNCGLETVGSAIAARMRELGLDPTNALQDTVRSCVDCGEKSVVYDLVNKKKGCLSCGATAKY